MTPGSRAFFLDAGARGQRLCVHHAAQGAGASAALGQVLLLPPFAEEMNKSRRMIALAARAFAAAGLEVLVMDLLGCGDSSGDFGDATWQDWLDDARLGAAWLDARNAGASTPLWLWSLRAGALLAPAVIQDPDLLAAGRPLYLLLWQPVITGKLQLQQFLRLRVAADLIGGQAKGAVQAMKDQIARGESVEIAGYTLSADVASGLDQAQLKPSARIGRVAWFELSTRDDATLTPAASMASQAWAAEGVAVSTAVVTGPSFWAATEIEEAPGLIDASVAALLARAPSAASAPSAAVPPVTA